MTAAQSVLWIVGPILLFVVAATSLVRPLPVTLRAVVVGIPVLVPLVAVVFGVRVAAPTPQLAVLAGFAVAACAVLGGNAVTTTVLALAERPGTATTPEDEDRALLDRLRAGAGAGAGTERQELRGGTAIGYLERLAILGALLLGRFELVAAVVAVKGLGRFSELQSAELRERFIVGTLASGAWATLCTLLVLLSA